METVLAPKSSLPLRAIVCVILLVPLGFAHVSWVERLLGAVLMLFFTGTYRSARIVEDRFEQRLRMLFVPLKPQSCRLGHVGHIATEFKEEGAGWGILILFGPLQWVICWVLDWLVPAFGGPMQIWLVTAKGREVLAWRGFNEQHYQHNLELLENNIEAETRRR